MASSFTVGLTVPAALQAQEKAAFSYDPAEFPDAKPWTSENFKNNPDNFQFTASETFDVGRDTCSPVADAYFAAAVLAFEGTLKRLYVKNLSVE
jgi:hypothetical protein